ncbi:SulP family inorganic anion transporter [Rhizobium alvei]|uniref:Sulfate permease n=1 Tax=Rhizobium alvei TaxID=1132659 RepID=A0ABT8YFN1_9HYPH|nr:sulfate permease [Rhizobium alvei]MDO6962505.1 sulfate permease [Rhizobium alvei]
MTVLSTTGLARYFPVLDWGRRYNRRLLTSDMIAAVIGTLMLIPQSLAYALLAGMPPETGLYASILPLLIYAIFGTSGPLAVGPVAVVSLMTASAAGQMAATGGMDHVSAAIALAFLSGIFLVAVGIFRLGFLANFLSHPVTSGFVSASGILIAAGQVKYLLGIKASGDTFLGIVESLLAHIGETSLVTLAIGASATIFLQWARKGLKPALVRLGIATGLAGNLARAAPVVAMGLTTLLAWGLDLEKMGVWLVGTVPQGLPVFALPAFDLAHWLDLVRPAILISIIGFVSSVSVAQTLAAKKREKVVPDQELIALGAANIASSISGAFPVTGGFARSVVYYDAGAETPASGAFTALGIALATLTLTPLLYYLPQATLAATIIVSVITLIDFSVLKKAWSYSIADFAAVTLTIVATLVLGVEIGILAGVTLSILLHLYKGSRPHMAVVGRVPGTEHYRNVLRHKVETYPEILTLRVDDSLYFANARHLEESLSEMVADRPEVKDVILLCSAVNEIDLSALESLEEINRRLKDAGVRLHLSEVKGPVMDRLEKCSFLKEMTGQVFLTQHQAIASIRGVEKDAPDRSRAEEAPIEWYI